MMRDLRLRRQMHPDLQSRPATTSATDAGRLAVRERLLIESI